MRKNMRQFNGFLFDVNSEQFTKKRERLLRWVSLQLPSVTCRHFKEGN